MHALATLTELQLAEALGSALSTCTACRQHCKCHALLEAPALAQSSHHACSVISLGRKRDATKLAEPSARLAWQHLLDPAVPRLEAAARLESPRVPRVAVCGMSHLGVQLADCLTSKAGAVDLAVYDIEADLCKYSMLPVRLCWTGRGATYICYVLYAGSVPCPRAVICLAPARALALHATCACAWCILLPFTLIPCEWL